MILIALKLYLRTTRVPCTGDRDKKQVPTFNGFFLKWRTKNTWPITTWCDGTVQEVSAGHHELIEERLPESEFLTKGYAKQWGGDDRWVAFQPEWGNIRGMLRGSRELVTFLYLQMAQFVHSVEFEGRDGERLIMKVVDVCWKIWGRKLLMNKCAA